MSPVRAAPLSAGEVPSNGCSAVLDVASSAAKEEQHVIQHIFLLLFTEGLSLSLTLHQLLVKPFVSDMNLCLLVALSILSVESC